MKNFKNLKGLLVAVVMLLTFNFAGCNTDTGNSVTDPGGQIPEIYRDFYNFPIGRQDNTGLLSLDNPYNEDVLYFHTSFTPGNYIGWGRALSKINVRLPNEEFYVIIAVSKKDFEERLFQASQASNITNHSRTQAYTIKVGTGLTRGSRQWVMNAPGKYWVKVVSASNPSVMYAVLAPGSIRVVLPLSPGDYFDYIPIFLQEIRYQNRVIGISEIEHRISGGTTNVDHNSVYTSNFPLSLDLKDLKPNVLLINNSGRTIRIYKTKTTQLTNGAVGTDFTIGSGSRAELITGFEPGDNVSDIYLWAVGWTDGGNDGFKWVNQSALMEQNKVYIIVVGPDGNTTSLEIKDASEVYE